MHNLYGLLASCQNLEKTNDIIPRKCPERRKDGWKDGQTLFHRTLLANAGGSITVNGRCWRLLIYTLRDFSLRDNVTSFQKQASQIHRKTPVLESLCFLGLMKLYKDIYSARIKVELHSVNVSHRNDAICRQMFFFSIYIWGERNILNKFVIFTNQKQALKITTGQQSLTIVKTFVTTKKSCQTITMTATT